MKSKFAAMVLLSLALVLMCSSAAALSVDHLKMEITVDRAGAAHVVETYTLGFFAGEKDQFKTEAEKNGSSLLAWQADFDWFYPHFESSNTARRYITFDEINDQLVLDYEMNEQFAHIDKELVRVTVWVVDDRIWQDFTTAGSIYVPEDVEIVVVLPGDAELQSDKLSSQAKVVGNTVTLSGISTNFINLEYHLAKPIAPRVGANIINESNILSTIAVILLVSLLFYWKRKPLSKRIEDYVVEHSEIETKLPREEIELEV